MLQVRRSSLTARLEANRIGAIERDHLKAANVACLTRKS